MMVWLVAVVFSFITLSILLTGLALPWDQTAYWRTVVTSNLVEQIPVVGHWAATLYRGGTEVSSDELRAEFGIKRRKRKAR